MNGSLSTTIDKEPQSSSPLNEKPEEDSHNTLNESDASTAELYFERESIVSDFERETVYDVDSFGKKSDKIEKLLAPPPNFQKVLQSLSPDLQKKFKEILNADVVGIWPIKQKFLLK